MCLCVSVPLYLSLYLCTPVPASVFVSISYYIFLTLSTHLSTNLSISVSVSVSLSLSFPFLLPFFVDLSFTPLYSSAYLAGWDTFAELSALFAPGDATQPEKLQFGQARLHSKNKPDYWTKVRSMMHACNSRCIRQRRLLT